MVAGGALAVSFWVRRETRAKSEPRLLRGLIDASEERDARVAGLHRRMVEFEEDMTATMERAVTLRKRVARQIRGDGQLGEPRADGSGAPHAAAQDDTAAVRARINTLPRAERLAALRKLLPAANRR